MPRKLTPAILTGPLLAALLAPAAARGEPPERVRTVASAEVPPPSEPTAPSYERARRRRKFLNAGYWMLGAGTLASTFGGLILLEWHAKEGAYAFIPVGGSFAALTGRPDTSSCDGSVGCSLGGVGAYLVSILLLVGGGVTQTTGGILLLAAPSKQRTVLDPPPPAFTVQPMPLFGNGMAGLGILGRF